MQYFAFGPYETLAWLIVRPSDCRPHRRMQGFDVNDGADIIRLSCNYTQLMRFTCVIRLCELGSTEGGCWFVALVRVQTVILLSTYLMHSFIL